MNKKFKILTIAVLLVIGLAIFFSSCSKDEPDPRVATSIELVSGGEQTATAGTALANPIEVIVKDQNGKVFQGVIITFAVTEGSFSSATAMTDVAGKASVTWTLGSNAGSQILVVTAFNGTTALTGSPLIVTATAELIVATSIELGSGGEQTGIIFAALANPIEVIVKDQIGNVFQGAPIAFAVSEGSLSSATATTDAAGKASVTWTLGSSTGSQTLIVTAFNAGTALTGSPVIVNATASSVTDIDGNTYPVVVIGNQIWMAENLKTTKYRDGTSIPNVTSNTEWSNLTTAAYCWYNNDEATYKNTYGALYNWHTVESRNLCPTGWHVPSDAEWKELEMYLGMSQADADDTGRRGTDEGGKLKETGTTHWYSPTGVTYVTGFTALPGGAHYYDGLFFSVGHDGFWWSATEGSSSNAWFRHLYHNYDYVSRNVIYKSSGFSVRCLRD